MGTRVHKSLVIGLASATAVVMLAWLLWPGATTSASAGLPPSGGFVWPSQVGLAEPQSETPPRAPGFLEAELCGREPVRLDRIDRAMRDEQRNWTHEQVLDAAVAELAGQGRPDRTAAALYLGATFKEHQHERLLLKATRGCEDNATCRSNARQTAQIAVEAHWAQLLTLASTSRDPVALALALQHCARRGETTACREVTAAQWAQADPENSAAWLAVSAAARKRNDTAGEQSAFDRAANARLHAERTDALLQLVAMPAVLQAPPLDRAVAQIHAMGVWAAVIIRASQDAAAACPAAMTDQQQIARCGRLAQLLYASNTLLHARVGVAMGERSGWPLELQRTRRVEVDALAQVANERATQHADPRRMFACETIEMMSTAMQTQARDGELAYLRGLLAQSKRSPEELAREYLRPRQGTPRS